MWVVLQKEQKHAVVAHQSVHYVAMMMLMSTCDDFVELISLNAMIGAMIAMTVMEYSIETCDIDMLMVVSYHQFSDDDIALVDADVDHICAVDAVAVAIHLMDLMIDWPLNLSVHVKMALN